MRNDTKTFSLISIFLLFSIFVLGCSKSGDGVFVVPSASVANTGGGGGGGGGGAVVAPTTLTITNDPTGTLNGAALSGNISITYDLTNSSSVLSTLIAEFSVNGVVFDTMTQGTGSDGVTGLTSSPSGTAHTFVWNSSANLPSSIGPRENIVIRLTATAQGSSVSSSDTSSAFDVNNNLGVPSATVSTPGTSSGTILVSYTLSDVDGDLINIIPEFSTNDGTSFSPATQGLGGNGTTGLATGSRTFAWQSAADIPGMSTAVRFRISPFDAETGIPGTNPAAFTVDNSTAPLATINTAGGGTLTGDATISVTFTDATATSPTTADIEFSTNGGLSFSPCTADATSDFDSSTDLSGSLGVALDFVWDTATDIPAGSGLVSNVIFRITPIESGVDGVPDSITVNVDNSGGGGGGFTFRPSTDKWRINILEDDDADTTPDFNEGLANADSGTNPGFDGNVPAARDALLSQLNVYYRNNADGSAAVGGMPISFQDGNGAGGTAPSPGTLQSAGFDALDFSSIAMRNIYHIAGEGGSNNPVGVAFFTSGGNTSIENNSQTGTFQSGSEELGVFIDRHNFFWNGTGFSPTQRTLAEYMKFLGQVTAHEIGHSIDFDHNSGSVSATNNIMAASSTIGPGVTFAFNNTQFSSGLGYMPGPNRCCNEMGLTPLQLIRSAEVIVLGTRGDGEAPLSFHVLEHLYGDRTSETVWLQNVEASHPIFQLPKETLFLACLQENGAFYQIIPNGAGLFAVSDQSEWIDLFRDYIALFERQESVTFREELQSRLQQDILSSSEQIRKNAMYEMMLERLAPELTEETVQILLNSLRHPNRSLHEKIVATQVLTLVARPEYGETLLEYGLEAPKTLLQAIAGALETSLGREETVQQLLVQLPKLTDSSFQNAITLMGWQKTSGAVSALTVLLKTELEAETLITLADALGRIQDPTALIELQNAIRATASVQAKQHLYRAIGQIGTIEAKLWLKQEQIRNSDPHLAETIRLSERFAHTLEIR